MCKAEISLMFVDIHVIRSRFHPYVQTYMYKDEISVIFMKDNMNL